MGAPGSSPLARGLLRGAADALAAARIIPARAGFTTRLAAAWRASTDHPRSRGVYWCRCGWPGRMIGSSPLARGLLTIIEHREGGQRIIPARAGFTRSPSGTAGS